MNSNESPCRTGGGEGQFLEVVQQLQRMARGSHFGATPPCFASYSWCGVLMLPIKFCRRPSWARIECDWLTTANESQTGIQSLNTTPANHLQCIRPSWTLPPAMPWSSSLLIVTLLLIFGVFRSVIPPWGVWAQLISTIMIVNIATNDGLNYNYDKTMK